MKQGKDSKVKERTEQRAATHRKNSLNKFISRERERERAFPQEEDKKAPCLSRSIQKHLVAFLYLKRGTKRATVCYCTQFEGPLLLNLTKLKKKSAVKIAHYRRKRSSEVSNRRKTQKTQLRNGRIKERQVKTTE